MVVTKDKICKPLSGLTEKALERATEENEDELVEEGLTDSYLVYISCHQKMVDLFIKQVNNPDFEKFKLMPNFRQEVEYDIKKNFLNNINHLYNAFFGLDYD